jgi:hypothetical protein
VTLIENRPQPLRGTRTWIGYLIAGGAIGALWLAHSGESPWEHALRLLALMGIAMAVSTMVRRWASRRGRRVPQHSIGRFLLAKLALLVLAVGAGILLQRWIPDPDVWIGVGLGVVVTVIGPVIHPWLTGASHEDVDTAAAA